jgi:hypothetical protein
VLACEGALLGRGPAALGAAHEGRVVARQGVFLVVSGEKARVAGEQVFARADADLLGVLVDGEVRTEVALGHRVAPCDRGRDARHRAPPAQIPACAIHAPGSHLGWVTAKRWSGHG